MTGGGVTGETRYRADIDGLRAVAVLSVLAFHAQVRGVYGGYVGVDVFFVISGYLITGIIQSGLERDAFSIAEFYKRRVHRIFPALLVVMAATTAVALAVLLPSEMVRYGKALAATALFGSNILFYTEAGYFDADAAVKPLLHTWSLAIEEQYYIFWPVLLWAAHRLKWPVRASAWVLFAASLAFSAWQVRADVSGAFYLLPARAWELVLGGLIAIGAFLPPLRARLAREIAAGAGLLMILAAVKLFTAGTPFPGPFALLPCLGAALVIHAGREGGSVAAALLGSPPARAVGLISYSLYLWHWPVIVFAHIGLDLAFTPTVQAGVLALSVALATLSWALVERPFQALRLRTPRAVSLAAAGAAIAAVCVGGFALVAARGLPARFTPAQRQLAGYIDYDGDALYRGGSCFLVTDRDRFDAGRCLRGTPGRPALLILGDSHAAQLWPGLSAAAAARGTDVLQATATGCKPLAGRQPGAVGHCTRLMGEMFDRFIPGRALKAVVIAARWAPGDLEALPATLARLKAHAARVVLVGPVPQYDTALPRLLVEANRRADPALPDRARVKALDAIDAAMAGLAARAGVAYVSPTRVFCRPQCRTLAAPGTPLQFDYGHLTAPGSALIAPLILEQAEPGRPGAGGAP